MASPALAAALDDALPQTQCTRCGFADCRAYADAMSAGDAAINQCPPGGEGGVHRLARLTGRPPSALNPAHGAEGPRRSAVIDESGCIGCTLCLQACPVDCIVGAPKYMHSVIDVLCTGCELCLPVCPVDCIALVNVSGAKTGWAAWSAAQAGQARERYTAHRDRLAREQQEQEARLAAQSPTGTGTAAVPQQAGARPQAALAALARVRAARASASVSSDP